MSRRSVLHDNENRRLFSSMWCNGKTAQDIAEVLGLCDDRAVRRWARRLALPARYPGWNNKRESTQ